ncbi:thioredoxin family protein [Pseudomonas aegrilactucae]|uniref:Thioredoxin family protein n=1 Tax=Pseudomonas aegrilactucae TaxID=2854028 RepID=A0A9Q3A9R4_9PSED|nr:thioredoxin family protein [Pseudomonas aegrilactucae]MBV6286292.1 thioredoxin family protein [Pseudomonas aegrilactucae]
MPEMTILEDVEAAQQQLQPVPRQRPCVVLLHSQHCPPCTQLHPEVERVARVTPEVDFFSFQAEGQDALCEELGVVGFPAQVFTDCQGNQNVVVGTNWTRINSALDKLLPEHLRLKPRSP